ncbi:BTAD domain-containing putative transcriptional regulator [Streptosporangium soli]|nr:winged helix-turn-helix domain-containing protein [Streptosporangium sp. KLBMP 9127]
MRFGILGAIEVRSDDGRPLAVGGPRARSLLALLLLDAGRVVTAERLIDGLYGAAPPAGVTNALQSHVSRLRQALKADDRTTVEFHPAGYRLAVDLDDVDAHRFERLAREGRRALVAGDPRGAAEALRAGLALWRGPALADVGDAPFAEGQAARLAELRLAALEDRIEAELALGAHRDLVTELGQLVAAHPLRERLRGQFMRALYGAGRQAEALTVYEDARRVLADELGADPSAELAGIHLAVLRGDPALTETARPVGRALPGQLTSFVGRTEELERVGKLLGEARLVTLTGPGGAGKTRLAIEAAGRTPGEVCFVDLAALGEGGEVPQAVLAALGLREGALQQLPVRDTQPPDPVARLLTALAERATLLVLDNCEHVVAAVATLVHRLLGACPELRILTTSREALAITGESLCPVPPLALPPPGASPVEAAGYPAVRLFAERAAAVRPAFEATRNIEAVVRVCRTLDGLPLAIELAAARLRSLEVAEVADRLDDRFRLLSRGSRTAQPRHQTLRAVVAWSWDLLDEAEQILARRLTVFSGGMTLEAAARVSGLPDYEVIELLGGLVDKSLVEVSGTRYRMLDTIRVFCAERLAEAGEERELRAAHAAYYLDLAATAGPRLHGAAQLDWLARLAAEHDNLHAALRGAVADRAIETGLGLVASLAPYWWLRGQRTEGAPMAADLLDVIGVRVPGGYEEEYLLCVLSAYVIVTRERDLAEHVDLAMRAAVALGKPLQRPFLVLAWGTFIGVPKQDPPAADSAMMRHVIGATDSWARALFHLGTGFQRLLASAELAVAEQEFARALALFRTCGERWGTATSLIELSRLADWRGDRDRALAMADEALLLVEQLGALEDMSEVISHRGRLRLRAGDLDGAEQEYERAAALARRTALPESMAKAASGLAEVARLRGDLAGARRECESALAKVSPGRWGMDEVGSELHVTLGRIAVAEGDPAVAAERFRDGLAAAVNSPSYPAAAAAAEGTAGLALIEDEPERAALLLGAAQALRGGPMAPGLDEARAIAGARARLGDAGYIAAFEHGAAMTRQEALTLLDAPFTV